MSKRQERLGILVEKYDVIEKFRALTAALNSYFDAVKSREGIGEKAAHLYIAKNEATICLGKLCGILDDGGNLKPGFEPPKEEKGGV